MNDFIDFCVDMWGFILFVLLVVVGIFALVYVIADADIKAKNEFIAECMQHQEHYQCVALWRAGESHDQVVPVFIPVR